jgi:polar amino acid transport system substrate-binding protein
MLRAMRLGLLLAAFGGALAQSPAPTQAPTACSRLIASGNPQYPPYLWRNPADAEQLIGANQELMQWLGKEIGLPIEVRYVGPWSRVQEEARAGRIDLIAGAFFTLPRTEYMDYVYPPFRETRSVVLVREAKPFNFLRREDLIGRAGLTVVNNSFGEEFDRFMRERLKMDRVASLEQALRMMEIGRADFLLYEDSPATAYIASLGIKGLKELAPPVAQERLYLTISHQSACNTAALRGQLTRAMYKLQREGRMNEFVQRGVAGWKANPAATEGR